MSQHKLDDKNNWNILNFWFAIIVVICFINENML